VLAGGGAAGVRWGVAAFIAALVACERARVLSSGGGTHGWPLWAPDTTGL
jgi:hypothetical protein